MLYDSPTVDRQRVLFARWLRVKHLPPVGYMHNRYHTGFVLDPERAPLLRQAWERVLAGVAVDQVHRELNEDLGFRTRTRGRTGGKPIARGAFYRMLRDPFYCAKIRCEIGIIDGEQPALVSSAEFEIVQQTLSKRTRNTDRIVTDA